MYKLLKDIMDLFPINGKDAHMALIMFGQRVPQVMKLKSDYFWYTALGTNNIDYFKSNE